MEFFLGNKKMDITSLRLDGTDLVLKKDGKETRHHSKFGWDIDDGFRLTATRFKNGQMAK